MVRVRRVLHRFPFIGSELRTGLSRRRIILQIRRGVVAFTGVVVGAGGAGAGENEGEEDGEEVHGSWLGFGCEERVVGQDEG